MEKGPASGPAGPFELPQEMPVLGGLLEQAAPEQAVLLAGLFVRLVSLLAGLLVGKHLLEIAAVFRLGFLPAAAVAGCRLGRRGGHGEAGRGDGEACRQKYFLT